MREGLFADSAGQLFIMPELLDIADAVKSIHLFNQLQVLHLLDDFHGGDAVDTKKIAEHLLAYLQINHNPVIAACAEIFRENQKHVVNLPGGVVVVVLPHLIHGGVIFMGNGAHDVQRYLVIRRHRLRQVRLGDTNQL